MMSLAEAGTIPVSAETPEDAPLAGDGKQREAPTPAKVKLALQPLKEAIAAVERHCEKFSGRSRFDGCGTIKCARLAKRLGRAGAESDVAVLAAVGGGEFRFATSQPWQRSGPISPEGVILILGPLKQAVAATEDHCDKQPADAFNDRSVAQCRELASRLGTAIADVFTVIALGLRMRGNFDFRARAEQ